jgi:uncharacterized membrane protein
MMAATTIHSYIHILLSTLFFLFGCMFRQSSSFALQSNHHQRWQQRQRQQQHQYFCSTPLHTNWNQLPRPTTMTAHRGKSRTIITTTSLSNGRACQEDSGDDHVATDSPTLSSSLSTTSTNSIYSRNNNDSISSSSSIWMPQLRKIMAGIASLGAMETGYLTYNKLFMDASPFCKVDWNCNQVLSGSYSVIPFTDIPLAALGFIAYLSVIGIALTPLLSYSSMEINGIQQQPESIGGENYSLYDDDRLNRILLSLLTTTMGTFSIFLMILLFGVLQASCPYCIFSAACSIILALSALIGGCLPSTEEEKTPLLSQQLLPGGTKTTTTTPTTSKVAIPSGVTFATLSAILLFASGQVDDFSSSFSSSAILWTDNNNNNNALIPTTPVASTKSGSTTTTTTTTTKLYSPPTITVESSNRAMALGKALQSLDAKMYGAYWCSHCYDQKQILGKQVFAQYVDYVECSKDGVNAQTTLCKAKEIPGYPTWEIQGKLYPGQQEIDELEDLVNGLTTTTPPTSVVAESPVPNGM